MKANYQIISVNGTFMPVSSYSLSLNNRAFRYGDGLFESMHANGTRVQFLDDHFQRLLNGAQTLKINIPQQFSLKYLDEHIQGLLTRCKLFQGTKVRILLIRKEGGLYIPSSMDADIIIEAEYLSNGPYELNAEGIKIDLYESQFLHNGYLSAFKSMNALPYILAGIYAKEQRVNDVLMISKNGNVVEAISSNVFGIKDKVIYTPALSCGCVEGIMRKQIIALVKDLGFEIVETEKMDNTVLIEMEELFLTNAVVGIRWIASLRNRRYYKRNINRIMLELNRRFINSSQD